MHRCICVQCTDKKVEKAETTQLKLLEGEGRANPRLSTLLSLQSSEPFAPPTPTPAPPPLHFYSALPFHMKMLVFPPESVTGWLPASGSVVMVSRETAKATLLNVPGYNASRPISALRHNLLSPLSSKLLLEPVFTAATQAIRIEDSVRATGACMSNFAGYILTSNFLTLKRQQCSKMLKYNYLENKTAIIPIGHIKCAM